MKRVDLNEINRELNALDWEPPLRRVKIPAGQGYPWPERRVVRVDLSPMNPKIKVAQLSCGHDVYRNRKPRIGATIVCDKCAKASPGTPTKEE